MDELFFDIGLIIILTTILGFICRITRQPLILAYIAAGILLGPTGKSLFEFINIPLPFLDISQNTQIFDTLSIFGIIFLLFLVGLEFNIKGLKGIRGAILGIALAQLVLTWIFAYFFILPFIENITTAFILAVSVVFSSTIIGIKILSDQKDLNTVHGKIVIGILLAQDLLAIFALILLSGQNDIGEISFIFNIIFKFLGLVLFTLISIKWILPAFFSYISRSQELLFLGAIANCFLFAMIAHYFNVSIEIGAFLAGVSLATLPYYKQIIGKIKPLRDFFIILFFVTLGLRFDFIGGSSAFPLFITVTVFTLVIKPLLIFIIVLVAGFKRRTAFLTGANLSQLSEFSLIVLALAVERGFVSPEIFSGMTLSTMVTIMFSTYFAYHGNKIYFKIHKYIKIRERSVLKEDKLHNIKNKLNNHIVLCGYQGMGEDVLKSIKRTSVPYVVVEINPDVAARLIHNGIPCVYGDITDPEILETVDVDKAKILVSTVSHYEDNEFLLNYLEKVNKKAISIVEGRNAQEALDLYKLGADYVIIPEFLGGSHASLVLEDMHRTGFKDLVQIKNRHIEFLNAKRR